MTEFIVCLRPESLMCADDENIDGEIWCQFGEEGFPEIGWSDLASAVVSWFLRATVTLVKSRKRNASMRFPDGPYEVRVFAKRWDTWEAEFVEDRSSGTTVRKRFDFSPDPFIRSLIACADDLLDRSSKNGWTSGDIDSIRLQRKRLLYYSVKKRGMQWATS